MRGLSDFFSMENGLEHVSLGVINSDALEPAVYTNSEHLSTSFLLETGLAYIGISLDYPRDSQYFPGDNQYCLKNLYIEGEDTNLILGYVTESGRKLSPYAEELISHIKELLEP